MFKKQWELKIRQQLLISVKREYNYKNSINDNDQHVFSLDSQSHVFLFYCVFVVHIFEFDILPFFPVISSSTGA